MTVLECESPVGESYCATNCVKSTIRRKTDGVWEDFSDYIIEEQVIPVFVNGVKLFTLVCSPTDLLELAIGRLFTEGYIDRSSVIGKCEYDKSSGAIYIEISRTSLSMDGEGCRVSRKVWRDQNLGYSVFSCEISNLMKKLESTSCLFHKTGGVHSAALASKGTIIARYDDLGRFNAIDKLAGWCLKNKVKTADKVLLFSGRMPHDVVAKVVRIGCPVIASPGAPTSLSIDLAEEVGLTIIGFVKENRLNVYSCKDRILDAKEAFAG